MKTYDSFYKDISPIATQYLEKALKKIFQENSFGFIGQYYLQIHGTVMGTNMAGAFANILMAVVETEILNRSILKPLVRKRYIDGIFSILHTIWLYIYLNFIAQNKKMYRKELDNFNSIDQFY